MASVFGSSARSRSPVGGRSVFGSGQASAASLAYRDALLKQVAASLRSPIPASASFAEFSSMMRQDVPALTEVDVNFLFTQIATVGGETFSRLLSRKPSQSVDVSSLSPESMRMLQLIARAVDASGQTLAQCFQDIDTNRDGKVSFEELKLALTRLEQRSSTLFGAPLDQNAVQLLFAAMDTSCDGTVSIDELASALAKAKTSGGLVPEDGARLKMVITRHVFNARGGAPPYRSSYLTATDEVTLDAASPLAGQKQRLIPTSGASAMFQVEDPAMYVLPPGVAAPNKWENEAALGAQKLDLSKTASDAFGAAGAKSSLVVLLPMMGMD